MVRRCCCCVDLRTGTLLVGVFFLLADTAALLWAALGAGGTIDPFTSGAWHVLGTDTLEFVLYATMAVSAVSVLCDVLLLVGAGRQRRPGLLGWLVWTRLRLVLLVLALLVLLAVALWLQFDPAAVGRLNWRRDSWRRLMADAPLTGDQHRWAQRHEFVVLAVLAGVGLLVVCLLWSWVFAVQAFSRRLQHATVIVHRSRTHTSRL